MTVRKTDNLLRGDRTPAYVGRETGAAVQLRTEERIPDGGGSDEVDQ